MLFPRFCAFLLAASCGLGAWAADDPHVTRGDVPRWVLRHAVDFAASDEAAIQQGEGTHLLLRDAQRHLGEATEYRHIAYRLLTQAGVQACSTLTFEFDPVYERLDFHLLSVHRAGQRSDRLPQQEIKVFQRETNLEDQLYDGRLTASVILEDLRVGDVIEYAYSRRGQNPNYAGHALGSIIVERREPIHQSRERLLCSTRQPQPQFQGHSTQVQAHVAQLPGDLMEYRWDADDQPARLSESGVPPWVDTLGWVQYSDFQSWAEVGQWAVALFAPAQLAHGAPLPEELETEAAALEQLPAGAPRIVAALRYVQDNFRYLGIEIGANSHQPYPVEKVCARRFGDCKDKANLLSALLRRLGFEADPAVVATDYRGTIAEGLPTPSAFNHAIVRVVWNGRAWWLDPTRRQQGGMLEHIYLPAYGKALVVSAAMRGLAEISPGGQADCAIDVVNTFRHTNYAEPALLHVRTTYRGAEADAMRETRATTSVRRLESDYLNFYARRYPGARVREALRFHDDLERNEFVADEDYELTAAWEPQSDQPGQLELCLTAGTLAERLTDPATRVRTLPFRVDFPSHVTERFEVELAHPPQIKPAHLEIDEPAFHFTSSSALEKGLLQLRYEYTARAPEVAADRVTEYSANIKRARETLRYYLDRPAPLSAAATGTSPNTEEPSESYAATHERVLENLKALAAGFFLFVSLCFLLLWHYQRARRGQLRYREPGPALHTCTLCHRTDVSHPDLEFRVAGDGRDYCIDHLRRPSQSPARSE